jgi:hypothetical protein
MNPKNELETLYRALAKAKTEAEREKLERQIELLEAELKRPVHTPRPELEPKDED